MRALFVVLLLGACGRIAFDSRADATDSDASTRGCVAELTAIGDQICAILRDGTVWCWGDNSDGNLGDGSISGTRLRPGPALVTDATHLGSGETHVCAVRGAGELVCWGTGTEGQLGDGAGVSRAIPTPVALQAPVVEVRGSQFNTCARLADGGTWCWGQNTAGQLGRPASPSELSPVLAPIGDALQLALSDQVTCALRADDRVWCFGTNLRGELGDGTTISRNTPMPIAAITDPVIHVAGGCHSHLCAVTSTGEVWCWGQNLAGQIGTGAMSALESTPRRVDGVPPSAQVAVGYQHTCARTLAGELWCWGDNTAGQLGSTVPVGSLTPIRVDALPGPPVDIHTSCGASFAVLADRTVFAWGQAAQLGTGATTFQSTPMEVAFACP